MNYLPVVRPEIGGGMAKDIVDKFDKSYLEEQLAMLDRDNPTIAFWIRTFSKRTDDKMGAAYCGLLVYKLLNSQAEANYMNEQLNLG